MCEVTEGLINKGVQKGIQQMQPKIDAAEARTKNAEARANKAEAEVARLRKYMLEHGLNPNVVAEEMAPYGKEK